MSLNILQTLEFINNRLSNIENNISRMEDKLDFSIQLQRNHLIRIKNGEDIINLPMKVTTDKQKIYRYKNDSFGDK